MTWRRLVQADRGRARRLLERTRQFWELTWQLLERTLPNQERTRQLLERMLPDRERTRQLLERTLPRQGSARWLSGRFGRVEARPRVARRLWLYLCFEL